MCIRDSIELQHLGWGAVGLEGFFKGGQNLEAVLALVHVDEVNDDDAAQIAEPNLADNLRDGVEVRLDDGVLEPRRLADILAGIDVDGDQGFSLVNDDGALSLIHISE